MAKRTKYNDDATKNMDELVGKYLIRFLESDIIVDERCVGDAVRIVIAAISNGRDNDVDETEWDDLECDFITGVVTDKIAIAIDAIKNS